MSATAVTSHITEAIERWAAEMADLGGAEPLTRFRDLKVGTLDLHGADPDVRRRLLDGEPVRVSRLFPHEPIKHTAALSARRLAERMGRLEEAHGIAVGYLATGLASWADRTSARRPMAPIMLRRVQVTPVGFGGSDHMLHVVGDPELNSRLLEAMAEQIGLRLTAADLLDPAGELRYTVVVDRLREQAPPHVVDGFAIAHRAVIGLMSGLAEDLAAELRDNASRLARHPLVALAAGAGSSTLAAGGPTPGPTDATGTADAAQHRVEVAIDLDSAQASALTPVRGGGSMVVQTPAGTGATQVAAALCAEGVAVGQTVLVVADSGPRLRGLRRRLAAIGLGGATLDLSDGLVTAPGIARDVLSALDAAAREPGGRGAGGQDAGARDVGGRDAAILEGYVDALHRTRAPWGRCAYDAFGAASTLLTPSAPQVHVEADALTRLDASSAQRLRTALAEFVALDGLTISAEATAWFGATPASAEEAEEAVALVDRLRSDLVPAAHDLGARAAAEVGMPAPRGPEDLSELTALLDTVRTVEETFVPTVWSSPLDRLAAASADRRSRRELADAPGMLERRVLRAQAQQMLRDPATAGDQERIAKALAEAAAVSRRWDDRARDGRHPRVGDNAAAAIAASTALTSATTALAEVHPEALPPDLDYPATLARLASLAGDAHWARRLPRLTEAAADLAEGGLAPVVAALRDRVEAGEAIDADTALVVLDASIAASMAEQIQRSDPVLVETTGAVLRGAAQRWRQADAAAVVAAADRARAAWVDAAQQAATERPVQVRTLRAVASASLPMPTRDLLAASWGTVRAARPVWLAGPLPAAATLPPSARIDLLVVLDAHGVALAHAIGVLAHADRVVVLGDPSQPPPSPTPLSMDVPDPRTSTVGPGAGAEIPSLYAVLRDLLPSTSLTVRYGCRDERLHAAMPATRTPAQVSVSAGAAAASPLELVAVVQEPGLREQEESVDAEVARVVDLVTEHLRRRPEQSLAVLTLGRAHAEAIERALARAGQAEPWLAAALGPEADEPFLLKPVEDLVGERRDAVILSVGFGRTMDGRLLYRYGPMNRPGGVRWLCAGVGAARRALTVVSTVQAEALEPRRLAGDGLRALRALLAVSAAADGDRPTPSLDPWEQHVHDRLRAAGLPVRLGGGSGLLATSLLLDHPGRPGRGVLVVEPDGGPVASVGDLRDRERMRPEQIMRAGWSIDRTCVTDWLRDADAEVGRVRQVLQDACRLADAIDAARNAPAGEPQAAGEGPLAAGPEAGPETRPETGSEAGPGPATDTEGQGPAEPGESEVPRPDVVVGRPVEAYPAVDLIALARWLEQREPGRAEDDTMAALGREIGLAHPTGRSETVLRRAVRAGTISHTGGDTGAGEAAAVDDPIPVLSASDEQERAAERASEDAAHEQWLADERPPHH